MTDESTAVAEPAQAEVEAPFGDALENFFKPPSPAPEKEPTPDPETQGQADSTDEPSADETKAEAEPAKPKSPKKGSPRPQNIEAKIKGLEKGFYKATRENAELRKEIQALKGETTAPSDESPEVIAQRATTQALERASLERATEEFGEEFIQEQIFAEGSPYRKLVEMEGKSWIRDRVLKSHDPIYEALAVIREHDLLDNYGRDIETVKATLKEELKAEVLKELKANPSLVGKAPPTLSKTRAATTAPAERVTNAPDLTMVNPAFNLRAI